MVDADFTKQIAIRKILLAQSCFQPIPIELLCLESYIFTFNNQLLNDALKLTRITAPARLQSIFKPIIETITAF